MTNDKLGTIMNAFFSSQLAYCPLLWMFHNRAINNRINELQERALRLVRNDNTSSFYELLLKDSSFTIHHRNIQKLTFEMYRVKQGIAPKIILFNELFNEANVPYNHSHKKRKDSLEGSLDRVLFAAELEFPKILVTRLPQNLSNVNNECAGKSKQLYSSCDQLLGALIYLHFIILILICF